MLDDFKKWLVERNKPSASRLYYFLIKKYLDSHPISPDYQAMIDYLNGINNPYTRNATHAALIAFTQYMYLQTSSPDWLRAREELKSLKYTPAKKPLIVGGKIRKESLSEEGVKTLLSKLYTRLNKGNPKYESQVASFVGTVLTFYFGWRPVESTSIVSVNKDERILVIRGAKTKQERLLVWHESLDDAVELWLYFTKKKRKSDKPFIYPTFLTRNLHTTVEDVKVTAKTGRKTVITLLRKRFMKDIGMDTRYIPHDIRQKLVEWWVGHTTTPVQDIYTDESEFLDDLRVLACKTHYMPEIVSAYDISSLL